MTAVLVFLAMAVAVLIALAASSVRERERRTMDFYKSDRFNLADAKAGQGY